MTTKKAAPARAREAQRERGAMTVLGAWSVSILEMLEDEHRIKFPSSRYRQDPVGFFREILGVEPWETDTCGVEVGASRREVAHGRGARALVLLLLGIRARDHDVDDCSTGRRDPLAPTVDDARARRPLRLVRR